jgi:hypothetical protein
VGGKLQAEGGAAGMAETLEERKRKVGAVDYIYTHTHTHTCTHTYIYIRESV